MYYYYYCKNCDNMISKCNEYEYYNNYNNNTFCDYTQSKNNDCIFFLDCANCKKFIGIEYWNVCENCFGEDHIFGNDKILFTLFLKYRKSIYETLYSCKFCNKKNFRAQFWYFEELTYHK